MAFSINEFRSRLQYGGARQNLFQVQIQNLGNASADLLVPFMVESTSIPASTLGTINVPYFGRQLKLAGDRTFAPWSVTIINDEDFKIRNAMEEWSNKINRFQRNVREIGTYKSQATVTQFAKDGSVLREYQFVGLFPQEISTIDLNWGTTDQIETFSVTFDYDYWKVLPGYTSFAGGE